MEQILPVLNTELLQEKANEFAMKGALKALEDYYMGYNSPYKKAIEEHLVGKGVDRAIEIPDIIGILNQSISKEIDLIANNAVSKSFVPLVKNFLTRAEGETTLSKILMEFIKYTGYEHDDELHTEDYTFEFKKDEGSFVYLEISNGKIGFELYFYLKSKKDETPKVYEIYTLPYIKDNSNKYSYREPSSSKNMKITLDGVTLELPFVPNVLEDNFRAYIAKMIIANTKITFDVTDFNDDMFPERDQCHCDDY
jgi:hypothetical protein